MSRIDDLERVLCRRVEYNIGLVTLTKLQPMTLDDRSDAKRVTVWMFSVPERLPSGQVVPICGELRVRTLRQAVEALDDAVSKGREKLKEQLKPRIIAPGVISRPGWGGPR